MKSGSRFCTAQEYRTVQHLDRGSRIEIEVKHTHTDASPSRAGRLLPLRECQCKFQQIWLPGKPGLWGAPRWRCSCRGRRWAHPKKELWGWPPRPAQCWPSWPGPLHPRLAHLRIAVRHVSYKSLFKHILLCKRPNLGHWCGTTFSISHMGGSQHADRQPSELQHLKKKKKKITSVLILETLQNC